jgi:hypothetical protein
MTERYNKVRECVKNYIDNMLVSGQPLMTVIEGLKSGGPLPVDLLSGCQGEDENFIRSRAQIIVTEYVTRQYHEQSAIIPENDILVPSLEDKPDLNTSL